MSNFMEKKAYDLTVGESIKLTLVITGAGIAITSGIAAAGLVVEYLVDRHNLKKYS